MPVHPKVLHSTHERREGKQEIEEELERNVPSPEMELWEGYIEDTENDGE